MSAKKRISIYTSFENISGDSLCVYTVEKGVSVFIVNNNRIELSEGNCLIASGSQDVKLEDNESQTSLLALSGELVQFALRDNVYYVKNGLYIIKKCLHTLKIHEGNEIETELATYRLLLELEQKSSNIPPKKSVIPLVVETAIGVMNEDSAYLYNVEEIAQEIGVSLPYLSREFKKHVGISPSDYLREVRIENSKRMLEDANVSITMVAQLCGFSGVEYFSKVFKKCVGITPSEYRITFSKKVGKRKNAIPDEAYL